MPSARRMRLLLLTGILAIMVVYYVKSGAQQTTTSPFYQKTLDLMKTKSQHAAVLEKESLKQAGQSGSSSPPDENMRDRLKDAESAAKKSANEAYKDGSAKMPAAAAAAAAEKVLDVSDHGAAIPAASENKPFPKPEGAADDGVAKVGNVPAASSTATTASATITEDAINPTAAAELELRNILGSAPVIIFSKSYCPHSAKAKKILLENHKITPEPVVVELDQIDQGAAIQSLLYEVTGRGTVPNVMVNGRSLGGGSDMEALWQAGKIGAVVERAGTGKVSVEDKVMWSKHAL